MKESHGSSYYGNYGDGSSVGGSGGYGEVHRVDFQRRAIEIAEGDSRLRQIFVGGVSMYATEDDLMRVFEPCGTVVALRWGTDRRTHKFRGFVHIEFASPDAVPIAVGVTGTDVKGRSIRVSAARGPNQGKSRTDNKESTDRSTSNSSVVNNSEKKDSASLKNSGEVCLRCRQPGHRMANCPKVGGSGVEGVRKAMVMCYNCGGNSHRASRCRKPKLGNGFTFATCFICGEKGHLSSQCEHNEKGLYPKGGGCRFCGSNKHLKKDCPEREGNKKKKRKLEEEGGEGGEGGSSEIYIIDSGNGTNGSVPAWQKSEGIDANDAGDFTKSGALDGENYAIESVRGAEVELDATVGQKRKKKKKKKDKRKHKKSKKTTFD